MKNLIAALALCLTSLLASAQGVVVLEYHEVVSPRANIQPNDTVVTTDQFNAQMKWLKNNGYATITVAQLAAYMTNPSTPLPIPANKKPIVISFDDGWTNQQNAYPALTRNGFTATFNIIAGAPGTSSSYLNWNQVKNLVNTYRFDVASHTMTHPVAMGPADFYNEITASKAKIESKIGNGYKVKTIAWSNGYFTPDMMSYAISSNYAGAQTIDENWCTQAGADLSGTPDCRWLTGNAPYQNPYLIKRVYVDGRCTTSEFGTWVTQGHSSMCAAMSAAAAVERAVVINTQTSTGTDPTPSLNRDPNRDRVDDDNDGSDNGKGDNRFKKPGKGK